MPIYVEWFGLAWASVGFSSVQAVPLSGLPIALICMHRPSGTEVIGAESCSEDAAASPDYQCICIGVLTTTATSTIGSTTMGSSSASAMRSSASASSSTIGTTTFEPSGVARSSANATSTTTRSCTMASSSTSVTTSSSAATPTYVYYTLLAVSQTHQ